MSEKPEVEVKPSVLTPKMWTVAIIVAILMGLVCVCVTPFAPFWAWTTVFSSFTGPLLILYVWMLLAKASPTFRKISPQQLTIIYAAASLGVCFTYSVCPYAILHNAITLRIWPPMPYARPENLSFIFGPPKEYVEPMLKGAPCPWNLWAPTVGWWIIYTIFWMLFFVGWFALVHERWIEVERLPFPFLPTATVPIEIITGGGEEKALSTKFKMFLLGSIIGLIFMIPMIGHYLYPPIPDIYGWAKSPYHGWWHGCMNLARVPGTEVFPVWAHLVVNPMTWALCYLLPLDILFSTWFGAAVIFLLPSYLAYLAGAYPGLEKTGWRPGPLGSKPPFKWTPVWMGMFWGVLLIWFILNAGYIRRTFTTKITPEDRKRALPFVVCWVLIIVSTLVILGLITVAGATFISAIAIVFTMWLQYFSGARAYGYAGLPGNAWFCPIDWWYLPYITKYTVGIPPHAMTPEEEKAFAAGVGMDYVTAMNLGNRYTANILGDINTLYGVAFAIPTCYALARETGTHPLDVTKVMIVAGIISAIIGWTMAVQLGYSLGVHNTPMKRFDAWWGGAFLGARGWTGRPAEEPWIPYAIAGVIFACILGYLRMTYARWPLDPIGVALGINNAAASYFIPALVAWIVKLIVLRVGGTKVYEDYTVPLAAGFVVGYFIMAMMGPIIGAIKFAVGA